MKTLLVTLEYLPFKGGVANYYANLAKYWPLGERIEILSNGHGELMRRSGLFPWLKAVGTILKKQKSPGFDCLLVGQILPLGTVAYLISWLKRFDYSVVLHGMDFTLAVSSWRKRLLTSLILGRADKIICANSHVATLVSELKSKFSAKIVIVNPGVEIIAPSLNLEEIAAWKKSHGIGPEDFLLLSLGRLVARKGVDAVIKALSGDLAGKKIKYFIAGTGSYEKELRSLASVSPFQESIIFLGEISNNDKWLWLNACDALIMPAREIGSDFEGFGIVYLEANLIGKPVIAGNSGGVKDAVKDNWSGLLVDPNDISAIRQAILRLANDRNLGVTLGNQGRTRALEKFNWERQAGRLARAIKFD